MRNSKFSCIIIDDEPIAIRVISSYLEKFEEFKNLGGFTNAIDALKILHQQKVDLMFLDIQMPGINGLEFIKSITKPPKVIFTTAYRNYAADAFEVDALDYLVKPIPFERFLKAINKFLDHQKRIEKEEHTGNEPIFIVLKSEKKNHKIKVDDILYIESLDDYVKVHTAQGKLLCYTRLTALESQLLHFDNIQRIHRSFMVNTKHITAFTHCNVSIGEKQIPIGRTYREGIAKVIGH
jgi:DNA-binding LytR/AlgR family response regulator